MFVQIHDAGDTMRLINLDFVSSIILDAGGAGLKILMASGNTVYITTDSDDIKGINQVIESLNRPSKRDNATPPSQT